MLLVISMFHYIGAPSIHANFSPLFLKEFKNCKKIQRQNGHMVRVFPFFYQLSIAEKPVLDSNKIARCFGIIDTSRTQERSYCSFFVSSQCLVASQKSVAPRCYIFKRFKNFRWQSKKDNLICYCKLCLSTNCNHTFL